MESELKPSVGINCAPAIIGWTSRRSPLQLCVKNLEVRVAYFFSISNNYTNRSGIVNSDRLCPNTGRRPIGEEEEETGIFYALLFIYANYVIEYLFHLQKYLMRIWEEQTFKF